MPPVTDHVKSSVSLSGSVAFAVRSTERLALAVQLGELVPSGQGSVIDALDDETETVGGRFIGGGCILGFR